MHKSIIERFALSMILGLALGLTCAQSSSASVVATVTYTGQASSIFDPTGLFGTPSQNLFSASFVDVFQIDLSKGVLNHYNFGGVPEEQLLGGTFYGAATPVVSSTLTINGHSVIFNGDRIGQEDNREGIFINSDAYSGAVGGESGFSSNNFVTIQTNAPLSIFSAYSGVAIPPNNFTSDFYICDIIATSPNGSYCPAAGETLNGFLTPETVTVTVADAVPEPASWLLMLSGFGGIGAVLRSRKSTLNVRSGYQPEAGATRGNVSV